MTNSPDDKDDDGLDIDELATQRARTDLERVFAEHKIPGRLQSDLFCFEFADLVGRMEILKTPDPTRIHAHMTVSGPKLTVPVLDCWAAFGKLVRYKTAHVNAWLEQRTVGIPRVDRGATSKPPTVDAPSYGQRGRSTSGNGRPERQKWQR